MENKQLSQETGRAALAALLLASALFSVLFTAPSALAATDKVTSSTALVLKTPAAPIPEAALLDVGIPTLNDGLYLTDEDDTVFQRCALPRLFTSPTS